MEWLLSQFDLFDLLALTVFLSCWMIYSRVVDGSKGLGRKGLVHRTHKYRELWARELVRRDNRVSDSALIGNLIHSVSFYANTTIYIMAGLFAVLGTLDQVMNLTSDLPFSGGSTKAEMEIKLLLVLAVFVVAYFKFTWSLRQFNLLSILVGAAPESHADPEYIDSYVRRMARVNSLAGDEFNKGIRAYYFAIASTSWMLHPFVLMGVSVIIVIVLIRRDFYSDALAILSEEATRVGHGRDG